MHCPSSPEHPAPHGGGDELIVVMAGGQRGWLGEQWRRWQRRSDRFRTDSDTLDVDASHTSTHTHTERCTQIVLLVAVAPTSRSGPSANAACVHARLNAGRPRTVYS
eukprot:SAG25_NODE_70_length_17370_cov_11.748885_13_plen_107_part_00